MMEEWRFEKIFPALLHAQTTTGMFLSATSILDFARTKEGESVKKVLEEVSPSKMGGLPTARVLGVFLRKFVDIPFRGMVLRRYFAARSKWRVLPESTPWHPGATWDGQ